MTPAEAHLLPRTSAYVVIDALRATTTMAVVFHRGLARLTVVSSVEAARAARTGGVLLLGEEGGVAPEGFDFGNSPVELAAADVAGREAIHVTTNGTAALCSVATLGPTYAGALVNLSAACGELGKYESVTFVCAGNARGRLFSLEDFAVAAAFVRALRTDNEVELGDAAHLALGIERPELLIPASEHAAVSRDLGFESDIELAMWQDAAPSVPFVREFGDGWAELVDVSR